MSRVTQKELLRFARRSQLGRPAYFGRDPANPRRWMLILGRGFGAVTYSAPTIRELAARIYARAYKHLQSPAQQLADRDVKRVIGAMKHAAHMRDRAAGAP